LLPPWYLIVGGCLSITLRVVIIIIVIIVLYGICSVLLGGCWLGFELSATTLHQANLLDL